MWQFTKQVLIDNFRMDIPQLAKPFVAQAMNKNLFTKAPIVPKSLETVEAKHQYTERTTKTARILAAGYRKLGLPGWFQSPARVDAFVHDTVSFIHYATFESLDQIMDLVGAYPNDPAEVAEKFGRRYIDKMTGFGTFIKPEGPRKFTRQQRAFYEYKNEYDKMLASYRHLKKIKDRAGRREYKKKYKTELRVAKRLTKYQRQLMNINARIKLIINNRQLSPEEKAKQIDKHLIRRQKVFEKAISKVRAMTKEKSLWVD